MKGIACAALVLVATPARADEPFTGGYGVSGEVGATADGGTTDTTGGGHLRVQGVIGDPTDEELVAQAEVVLELWRTPSLGDARALAAAPYSQAIGGFGMTGTMPADGPPAFPGVERWGFPVTLYYGGLRQGDVGRTIAGGEAQMMRNCWRKGDDGERTCLSWASGGGTLVDHDQHSYSTVADYLLPLEGLRIGRARLDARFGLGSIGRARRDDPTAPAELSVSAFLWDVRVRGRLGDVAVAAGTRRDPIVAIDGAVSFEDRVQLDAVWQVGRASWAASVHAARTRWYSASRMPPEVGDTLGLDLSLATRFEDFDLAARAAAGRSFYPTLDAEMPMRPAFGMRWTLEISYAFDLYRRSS